MVEAFTADIDKSHCSLFLFYTVCLNIKQRKIQ